MTGGVRPFTLADPASAPNTDDVVNDKSINTKTVATTERTSIAAPKSKTFGDCLSPPTSHPIKIYLGGKTATEARC